MTVLLQVSDPHFGTEQAPVVAALERFARAEAPAVLLLSGDITQRATRRQFAAARAFAGRIGAPALLAIPGNHDISLFNPFARLLWPYANHRRAFGDDLEPTYDAPALRVLTLNTTRPWRHKDGEVSAAQVERVARQLEAAAPAQLRIVVTHQPVAVTRADDEPNRLHGHELAVRRWAAAGADLVLGGHIHLPFVLPLQPVYPGLARPVWAVQAGTAVSSRVRGEAGNSVNLVRVQPAGTQRACVVERWDYAAARQAFELAASAALSF